MKLPTWPRRGLLCGLTAAILLLLSSPAFGTAKWYMASKAETTVAPGDEFYYAVLLRNVGDTATETGKPVTFKIEVPDGLTISKPIEALAEGFVCSPSVGLSVATCISPGPFQPNKNEVDLQAFTVSVEVDPLASGILSGRFAVSGGGIDPLSIADPTTVSVEPPGFGADAFDIRYPDSNGAPFRQAGGHPDGIDFNIDLVREMAANNNRRTVDDLKTYTVDLPPGLIFNLARAPRCTTDELAETLQSLPPVALPNCPVGAQIGTATTIAPYGFGFPFDAWSGPVSLFNLEPPPGVHARYGANFGGILAVTDVLLRNETDHGFTLRLSNAGESAGAVGFEVGLWGDPSDPSHDLLRSCPGRRYPAIGGPSCLAASPGRSLLRYPTACTPAGEGLTTKLSLISWQQPDVTLPVWSTTHELPGYPADPTDPETPWGEEVGSEECADVPARGVVTAKPTTDRSAGATGLDLEISIPNGGLSNAQGIATSDIEAVTVKLPEGVTANPARAEGLDACRPSQYAAEKVDSAFGSGCPAASKIGTVAVDTPLLEDEIAGSVFLAQPDDPITSGPKAENPFDSLLALYLVLRDSARGVFVKLPAKIEVDPRTGQLSTTVEGIPQLPFERFRMHLPSGLRSPLVTPSRCGEYEVESQLTPRSDPGRRIRSLATFELSRGADGGACVAPGFEPVVQAGSLESAAGAFSPFLASVTRQLGDQELRALSLDLPPGLALDLAGVARCSDAALGATAADTGVLSSTDPICPAASRIGETAASFGLGPVRAFSKGGVFLAGPYRGAPMSLAAVIPLTIGPYDLGTVVQRSALTVDPRTAAVRLRASGSTLPHAVGGIPLHIADLRIRLDRDHFLNPTSCARRTVAANVDAAGADPVGPQDDTGRRVMVPFAASDCSSLDFGPRMSLALTGDSGRGGHPGLVSTLRPRRGKANLRLAEVRLPGSLSLDRGNLTRTCSARAFRRDACPKAARRGSASVATPLLDRPLTGPVYLRASKRGLPELAVALDGPVEIDLVGRLEAGEGGVSARFAPLPDVPVRKLVLRIVGGENGPLRANAGCGRAGRGDALLQAQNGLSARKSIEPTCGGEKG